MIPVVISGGSGTRLWPVSRAQYPKQFCPIFGTSLQTRTLQRCSRLSQPWVLTGLQLKNLTEINLRENNLPLTSVIYEPFGKNTAPAIALLCRVFALKGMENEIVGVFPSDHLIRKESEFIQAVELAEKVAETGKIVTLGIQPSYPETGYGYIQTSSKVTGEPAELAAKPVVRFHEKPSKEKAEEFISTGCYFWNAGIFIFKVQTMIAQFECHQSALWSEFKNLKIDMSNLDSIYAKVQSISIDYAIMEKLTDGELFCVPADIGWSDVGSWDAVADEFAKDGQTVIGGSAVSVASKDNFAILPKAKNISFVGVQDLVVIDTGDALLVSRKGETQKIRLAVEQVEKLNKNLTQVHTFEDRPWGRFEILRDTEHFKSKVIRVNPHSQLSYQSHAKREEHWIMTAGRGEVVLNDQTIAVTKGSHIHIPVGAKHRIRNNTDQILEFVEVQLGTYFGEDDIVRYQDDYKRT